MFKLQGLDKLQRDLKQATEALQDMEGELGTVSFKPHDPASIEAAITEINRLIDARLGGYANNAIVGPLAEEMKEKYRQMLLDKAAAARLEGGQS